MTNQPNQFTQTFWTEARIAELKSRWLNWETFTEIALAIGHRSRNAVIGKAHRLGLRRNGVRPAEKPQRPRRRRIVRRYDGRRHFEEEAMVEETPPGFANAKPFIALGATDCRWPGPGLVGPDLLCCAAPALDGYPYCLAHCRMAYAGAPAIKGARR